MEEVPPVVMRERHGGGAHDGRAGSDEVVELCCVLFSVHTGSVKTQVRSFRSAYSWKGSG
eukprot:7379513-Prymnesium_polylepis.3